MIELIYEGDLRTLAIHSQNGSKLSTDAPKDNQGKGELFSPTDLVTVAAASCALTLMGIEARRLGVELQGLSAQADKTMVTKPLRKIGRISIRIVCKSRFDDAVRQKLEKAAKTCPVHESLHPDLELDMTFEWGGV